MTCGQKGKPKHWLNPNRIQISKIQKLLKSIRVDIVIRPYSDQSITLKRTEWQIPSFVIRRWWYSWIRFARKGSNFFLLRNCVKRHNPSKPLTAEDPRYVQTPTRSTSANASYDLTIFVFFPDGYNRKAEGTYKKLRVNGAEAILQRCRTRDSNRPRPSISCQRTSTVRGRPIQ